MQRKSHWEHIYDSRSPQEVSWFQIKPERSLALIHATGVARDESIIDVGGGASRLVDCLVDEGYRSLAVLDIAAAALAHARARLGARAGQVEWFEADVTAFEAPHPFQLWHDRAVFHFLTDAADRARYVEVLDRTLVPGGHLIMAAFAPGGPTQCSGLDIVQYDGERLSAELGPGFELLESGEEMHLTPAGKEQRFGFFRLRKRAH